MPLMRFIRIPDLIIANEKLGEREGSVGRERVTVQVYDNSQTRWVQAIIDAPIPSRIRGSPKRERSKTAVFVIVSKSLDL